MDNRAMIQKSLDYIEDNLRSEISAAELAEMAGFSLFHYYRLFQQATGLPVMQYILNTRIVLAKHMLEKENLSISEISEQCGFSSISYFCRVFTEETSLTPLQYKNSNNRKP